MSDVLLVATLLIIVTVLGVVGTLAYLWFVDARILAGKPFRECPSCGHVYDRPVDLFDAHIAVMETDELMTCPVCTTKL